MADERGFKRNSVNDPRLSRREFNEQQADSRLPYWPEMEHVDSSFSSDINRRNYIGWKDEVAEPERIEGATPEGLRHLS